ncbi:hypothetical protein [Halobacteriaceae bacterium SHR40]|uniref:hypothetical protein n=1 Tax=Halovenus amylolytica TaxID=2500550 RepID=UPI000FE31C50
MANRDTTTIQGAIHDVTDRRERQQELKSERRFSEQALNALDDLFYVINADGSLRRWNCRVPVITGYPESELDDMRVTDSVCCGNFRDHVTNIGVSRHVTDVLLHDGGKDSQQTL